MVVFIMLFSCSEISRVVPTTTAYSTKASLLVLVSKAHYSASPFIVQMSYSTALYVPLEFISIFPKGLRHPCFGHAIPSLSSGTPVSSPATRARQPSR